MASSTASRAGRPQPRPRDPQRRRSRRSPTASSRSRTATSCRSIARPPEPSVTRTLLLTGLRDLVRGPLHTGLMALGMALGVAVVVAIDLANDSARRGFLADRGGGRASHPPGARRPVGPARGPLAPAARRCGLPQWAPVVEAAGRSQLPTEPSTSSASTLSPRAVPRPPGGGSLAAPASRALLDPRAAVSAPPWPRARASPRQRPAPAGGGRIETLEVRGRAHRRPRGAGGARGGPDADVGAAQRLFRLGDHVSRIDLIASEGEPARVAPLAPGARVAPASEQAAPGASSPRLPAQPDRPQPARPGRGHVPHLQHGDVRRGAAARGPRDPALLGVTGEQVFVLILPRRGCLGLGRPRPRPRVAPGPGRRGLVTQTINDLYSSLSVTGAPLTARPRQGRGPRAGGRRARGPRPRPGGGPRRARRGPAPQLVRRRARRLLPRVGAAGAVLAALGGCCSSSRTVPSSRASPLCSRSSWASLSSPRSRRSARWRWRRRRRPLRGHARAARHADGHPLGEPDRRGGRRPTVAVSVTIGVGLMIESFRSTVGNWLDLTCGPTSSSPRRGRRRAPFPTLSPDVAAKVAAVPGVAGVETFRSVSSRARSAR